jgi:hypothetical protein
MWSSGEAVVLQTNLLKGNQQIRIHPSSQLKYPAVLPSGSVGEIIENSGRELFVKFMLRKPARWEQPFLADNTVYVTIPLSLAWTLKKA